MIQNKTVIRVLDREHGEAVIQWFKSQGVDTNDYTGSVVGNYYGLDSDGTFTNWNNLPFQFTAIALPPPPELPKRGDKILVWDNETQLPMERLFVAYVEGASYPVMCVSGADEEAFLADQPFSITEWRHYRPVEPILELTIEEIAKKYCVATVKIVESKTAKS